MTPSTAVSAFSTRPTHPAQVMPPIDRLWRHVGGGVTLTRGSGEGVVEGSMSKPYIEL